MSDPDIAILLSVADDYDAAGPPFATLAALMRRVAGKLHEPNISPNRSTAPDPAWVIDGDSVPGVSCVGFGCED